MHNNAVVGVGNEIGTMKGDAVLCIFHGSHCVLQVQLPYVMSRFAALQAFHIQIAQGQIGLTPVSGKIPLQNRFGLAKLSGGQQARAFSVGVGGIGPLNTAGFSGP